MQPGIHFYPRPEEPDPARSHDAAGNPLPADPQAHPPQHPPQPMAAGQPQDPAHDPWAPQSPPQGTWAQQPGPPPPPHDPWAPQAPPQPAVPQAAPHDPWAPQATPQVPEPIHGTPHAYPGPSQPYAPAPQGAPAPAGWGPQPEPSSLDPAWGEEDESTEPTPLPDPNRPQGWGPSLTAVIVKSDGGEYAVSCVRSLRREWIASGYRPDRLQIMVVQNLCAVDQSPWLETMAQEGASIFETGGSVHNAAAVEFALQYSSGDEDDLVAVLSPFLIFLPGSVGRMVEYMASHPECGMIGPRCYFDEGKRFQHPCLPLPTASVEASQLLSVLSPMAGRRAAGLWSEDNIEWWSVREPLETDMLSSGCLFVSRGVMIENGFLFDTSFPLGYEDADLCRRIRASRRWVAYLPKAEVILHGLAVDTVADPVDLRQRFEASRRAYFGRYLGWAAKRWISWLERRVDAQEVDPRELSIHPLAELGGHAGPFELELPPPGDWVLEVSSSPQWNHSIGCFALAGPWRFPDAAWSRLERGYHYLRVIDLASREVVCAYRFEKMIDGERNPIPIAPPGQYQPSIVQHWPTQREAG